MPTLKFSDLRKNKGRDPFTMYRAENKDTVILFDSIGDLVSSTTENLENNTWRIGHGGTGNGDSWTFGSEMSDLKLTREALETGSVSTKSIDRVEEFKFDLFKKFPELDQIQTSAVLKRRRRRFTEAGDELDIDRWMGGEVECWSSNPRTDVKKSFKIFIDLALSGGNNADEIMRNMTLFVAILDILNTAGISTEVWAGMAIDRSTNETSQGWCFCRVKSSTDPLDVSRMLSAGLPGFFRYYGFRVIENIFPGTETSGYGTPTAYGNTKKKYIQDFLEADLVLTGANYEQNATIVINHLKEMLNEY